MILDDEIIAGLLVDGTLTWYVSQRPIWLMDHDKWSNAFLSAGYELPTGWEKHNDRFGIGILNQESLELFVSRMSSLRMESELLSVALQELGASASWDDLDSLFPSLLLNFNSRSFFCIDREDYPYEKYMAGDWSFLYGNFLASVTEKDRYWIVDGIDYFADLYK